MCCLRQLLTLPLLYRKSATICQMDSNKISNSKLKPDLFSRGALPSWGKAYEIFSAQKDSYGFLMDFS